MGSPVPTSSPPISPVPAQRPPTFSTAHLLYLLVICFIVSLTCFLGEFIWRRLFPDSRQLHDPDATPSDATAAATTTATNAVELVKSDRIVISMDDGSPLSSEAGPSGESGGCPICLEELAEGEEVRVLPRCRHAYHRACIDRWLVVGSRSCPVCRDRLTVRLARTATAVRWATVAPPSSTWVPV